MNSFWNAYLAFFVCGFLMNWHMRKRNTWVFKIYMGWLEDVKSGKLPPETIDTLPTYNYMMLRFWRWSEKLEDWQRKA